MKTPDLIKNLSGQLREFRQADGLPAFLAKWSLGAAFVFGFVLCVLPFRQDLALKIGQPRFLLESALWLGAAVASAIIVYRSAIPGLLKRGDERWAYFLFAALSFAVLARFSPKGIEADFLGEMDLYRGRCGPLILVAGALGAGAFLGWVRRSAPTRLSITGAWISVCSGCLGAFAIQFVCAHENALHFLIWHFTPVALLSFAGLSIGSRLLRW